MEELNAFLAEIVEAVFKAGGSVNKFLGDAVLAVFGAPIAHDDDPRRAAAAAREIEIRVLELNEQREAQGKPPIRIGIGIATGEVVAGNVGSHRRLEYTVIGDPVNLASRLQALSTDNQILLDEETATQLGSSIAHLRAKPIGPHKLKGFDSPVELFELSDSPHKMRPT